MACSLAIERRREAPARKSQPRRREAPAQTRLLLGSATRDLGADAAIGEDLEQDRVLHPTVDHVTLLDAAGERRQRALDLRDHTAGNHALLAQALTVVL